MTLCVYPSKMADWQVECKIKLLFQNEIKQLLATERTAVLSIVMLRHYLPRLCFSQKNRFPQFCAAVLF